MAEAVQAQLEQQVTELQDLKKRGLFSDGEIK